MKILFSAAIVLLLSIAGLMADQSSKPKARFVIVNRLERGSVRVPYTHAMTLVEALIASGAPLQSNFRDEHYCITRGVQRLAFSRKAIKKSAAQDPKLQPGDFIQVEGED